LERLWGNRPHPFGRARRAAAIAEAIRAFDDAVPDLGVLLQTVAERVSTIGGDFCSVVLVSADGRTFTPLVAHDPDPALVAESAQFLGVPMDIDDTGPWGRVLRHRETAVLQIDPDHPPEGMAPHQRLHIQHWRIREAALIPLMAGEAVVGGLNVNRLEGNPPFSLNDIQLLERLGAEAGRAIATARVLHAGERGGSGQDA
jgi:GAF domain-containing protein